jgi:hypothetical protein
MVALGEQKLDDQFPVRLEAPRVGADHHVLGYFGEARRLQLLLPFHFDQAQPARSHIGEPSQMAQPRDLHAAFPSGREDGLTFEGRDGLAV